MIAMKKRVLRLILGDQLNIQHSWFSEDPEKSEYVVMEVSREATYVKHHIQKVVLFFLAMRAFSQDLTDRGFHVRYIKLDDASNAQSFVANIQQLLDTGRYSAFEYQQPDEYRVAEELSAFLKTLELPGRMVTSEHFLTEPEFFKRVFHGHKRYTMETFYREVRKKYGLLMEGADPLGGRWNFDSENRDKLSADVRPPPPLEFPRDVSGIVKLLKEKNIPTIGTVDVTRFSWAVTRDESLRLLRYFCEELLPHFGSYQDAMHTDYAFLFHSRLSPSLNLKLVSPLEVVNAAIEAFERSEGRVSIAQIEGFVRQIVGWREFMRGIYWTRMPQYKDLNYFEAKRPLPQYFWTGDTKMNCVKHAVTQSLATGYAHHIQRLMVTGNFSILAGLDPDEVDQWYLGIYVDAIEWVQLPNTRGMSQFADGGIVGTKPYTSSGQYINKMSNYCASCHYSYKDKFGGRGCPFNTLYWDFLTRNRSKLEHNPRIGMAFRTLDKMSEKDKREISAKAASLLSNIEEL